MIVYVFVISFQTPKKQKDLSRLIFDAHTKLLEKRKIFLTLFFLEMIKITADIYCHTQRSTYLRDVRRLQKAVRCDIRFG